MLLRSLCFCIGYLNDNHSGKQQEKCYLVQSVKGPLGTAAAQRTKEMNPLEVTARETQFSNLLPKGQDTSWHSRLDDGCK